MQDQLTKSEDVRPMPPHVITKEEAERALDRFELDRLYQRYGWDTILTWLYQAKATLRSAEPPLPSPGTITDVRR